MVKAIGAKRILTVVCAAVLAVGVFAATAAANPVHAASGVGNPPTPPYFYVDPGLTYTPPMGNATVADIEHYIATGVDEYWFFLQPETFVDPATKDTYIGSISGFSVWDPSSGNYIDCMNGSTVPKVPASYVYNDSSYGTTYLYVILSVEMFDITTGAPGTHLTIPAYFDATKLP
jgi:hypothetical protein